MASWKSVKKEISRFIGRVENRRVSSACVVGPHGSGKSTGMVAHIAKCMMDIEDTSLTYLFSTELEAAYMAKLLDEERDLGLNGYVIHGLPTPTVPRDQYTGNNQCVCVATFNDALSFWRVNGRPPFSRRAVVLVDLETNPTTEGEVLLGRVLEWARSCHSGEGSACAVMTIAPFRSQRTEETMRRVIDRAPSVITIPGAEVAVPVARVSENHLEREVKKLVSLAKEGKGTRVFVGYEDSDGSDDAAAFGSLFEETAQDLRMLHAVAREPALQIIPSTGISLPVPGLGHFCSKVDFVDQIFDRGTSQVISITRPKTRAEVLREQSWLVKSSVPVEQTVFHATYDVSAVRLGESEPVGKAYNGDIMWTALSLVEAWPLRTSQLPIRMAPDESAMAEACRRLAITGSIRPGVPRGTGQITPLGECMLAFKRLLENTIHLRYEEANLLASIPAYKNMSKNALKVIIRLACLFVVDVSDTCQRTSANGRRPSARDVQDVCEGIGARLAHKGAAWITLGAYQKLVIEGTLAQEKLDEFLICGPIVISTHAMKQARELVVIFEDYFGLPKDKDEDEIRSTELTDDEILFVEDRLMRAYIYRTVHIGAGTAGLVDLASRKEFSVCDVEITDPASLLKVESEEACVAIYNTVEYDGEYFVRGITTFPNQLVKNFHAREGKSFALTTRTSYPLEGPPQVTMPI